MTKRVYDESELVERLGRVSPAHRVVFAASCAERTKLAIERFSRLSGDSTLNVLCEALDRAWKDPQSPDESDEFRHYVECMSSLLPEEDMLPGKWIHAALSSLSACTSIVYTLSVKQTGSAQEAAWAARTVYCDLDDLVISSEHIDMSVVGAAEVVLRHPTVQAELIRQDRDIRELEQSDDISALVRVFRARSQQEAERICDISYAATFVARMEPHA